MVVSLTNPRSGSLVNCTRVVVTPPDKIAATPVIVQFTSSIHMTPIAFDHSAQEEYTNAIAHGLFVESDAVGIVEIRTRSSVTTQRRLLVVMETLDVVTRVVVSTETAVTVAQVAFNANFELILNGSVTTFTISSVTIYDAPHTIDSDTSNKSRLPETTVSMSMSTNTTTPIIRPSIVTPVLTIVVIVVMFTMVLSLCISWIGIAHWLHKRRARNNNRHLEVRVESPPEFPPIPLAGTVTYV